MNNKNKIKLLLFSILSFASQTMAVDLAEALKLPVNVEQEVKKQKAEAGEEKVEADDKTKVIGEAICRVEVSKYNTVSVHAQNVRMSTVLQELAIKSHRNIILAAGADRMVSMTFYSVPFEQALQTMLDVNGLAYNVKNTFISVFTKKELTERAQGIQGLNSVVFTLNYIRPKDALVSIKGLLSKDGSAELIQDDEPEGIQADMSMAATKKSSPVYKPEKQSFSSTSSLIVHDYAENIKAIKKLIDQLDKRPPQVLLEATVLEVGLNEDNALGVDFAILKKSSFLEFFGFDKKYSPFSTAVRDPADNNKIIYDDKGVPVRYDTSKQEGGSAFVSTSVGNMATGASTIKGGFSYGDFAVFIRALSSYTNVSVLSNPKVLSLDRQRARVMSGKNVGYVERIIQDGQVVETTKFIETGIVLDVRPYVLKNGKIRLVMSPKVSDVEFRNNIPTENIKTVEVDIVIPQGATAVIGGLIKESITKNAKQIPMLGDLPGLGNLARGQDDATVRSELIFMIKATVINDNDLADTANNTKNDVEQLLSGSRRGLLYWSKIKQSSNLSLKAIRAFHTGRNSMAQWMARRSLQLNCRQPDVIRELVDTIEKGDIYTSEDGAMYDYLRERLNIKEPIKTEKKVSRAKATVLNKTKFSSHKLLTPKQVISRLTEKGGKTIKETSDELENGKSKLKTVRVKAFSLLKESK